MIAAERTNVLLTGATGFIGEYVLRELANYNVSVMATYRTDKLRFSSENHVHWLKMDMEDGCLEVDLPVIPDILIHLAWGGLPNYKSDFHTKEELIRQKRFLDEAINLGVQNLFVLGTCFEYGMLEGMLCENQETEPHTEYGAAKDQLRQYLQLRQKEVPYNLTWGRLFYLFGEGQGERSLYTQLQNAIRNNALQFDMSAGKQERDFLSVEKAAKYIVDLALLRSNLGLVNICSGRPKSVKNLIGEWLTEANAEMDLNLGVFPYPDYEAMRFWGDNRKLSATLIKD